MSDAQPALPNRQTPFSQAFREFIPQGWAPYASEVPGAEQPARLPASEAAVARRDALAARFPGERLVVPAGGLKVRSNDCDYTFRPHSSFAWLTGLGADREPDAVLVIEPTDSHDGQAGHTDTLYFNPRAPRTDPEFYASARYGEMWVGERESLGEMRAITGIDCAHRNQLDDALAKNADSTRLRVAREADADIATLVDRVRGQAVEAQQSQAEAQACDEELQVVLSTMRLVKDGFEADQLRQACRATAVGFEAVVADLPRAVSAGRGERWVEGVFGLHARHQGNAVGYETIAAGGDHANTLHWIRNDGDLAEGSLLLLDAGVELDSLYTADVTRTLPVSGTFTPAQRQVYEAVLEAQQAGIAAARPGNRFSDVHAAAIAVVARYLHEWGLLPVSPEETLSAEGGQYRRWMVHGTSHHLGIDVHDCAQALREDYRDAELKPGMVITVEPGIYLRASDLLVPEELRGIGVRIEDDILITADGNENLSAMLPRSADEVEAWMAGIWAGGPRD